MYFDTLSYSRKIREMSAFIILIIDK
jgi:hypothetical protein